MGLQQALHLIILALALTVLFSNERCSCWKGIQVSFAQLINALIPIAISLKGEVENHQPSLDRIINNDLMGCNFLNALDLAHHPCLPPSHQRSPAFRAALNPKSVHQLHQQDCTYL